MGDVLQGPFRAVAGTLQPHSQGSVLPGGKLGHAHRSAVSIPSSDANHDPAGPVFVNIDAIARLGASLGYYVGCHLATERARKADELMEVVHHGHAEWMDALALEVLTEKVRADEVMQATTSFGRTEFRQVARAFRAALSRILDGP